MVTMNQNIIICSWQVSLHFTFPVYFIKMAIDHIETETRNLANKLDA